MLYKNEDLFNVPRTIPRKEVKIKVIHVTQLNFMKRLGALAHKNIK